MSNFITPIKPMELSMGFNQEEKVASVAPETSIPFKDMLFDAINQTNELSEQVAQDNVNVLLGDVDNLAQVQINSLKAETMLQTTVQLTSRVVSVYKEIMQMQI